MTTINRRIKNFLTRSDNYETDALTLFHDVGEHIANNRDWDGAARMLGEMNTNLVNVFKMVLRARFGTMLKVSADKKHSTGFRFTMAWEANEVPVAVNAFGVVKEAVDHKVKVFDKEFLKELREALGETKTPAQKNAEKLAKTFKSAMDKNHVTKADLIRALNALYVEEETAEKTRKALVTTKKVEKEDEVIDLNDVKGIAEAA